LGLGAAAASARLKLVASLPVEWREQAVRVGERLHIDPVDWYRTQDTPEFLRDVADAVWRGRRLSIRYASWRGTSRHDLEPLGLVLKAGAWYLLARKVGKEGWRTYRLASIQALTASDSSFKRPRGFDLAHAWQESARLFEANLQKVQVRVRLSPRCLSWLSNARIEVVALPTEDGRSRRRSEWREVLMKVEAIENGARQLLGYGSDIEVLAPAELREEMHRQAGLLMNAYSNP
jgi:predicted DNA-binding transcriptional regulator YafY